MDLVGYLFLLLYSPFFIIHKIKCIVRGKEYEMGN
jgi:hypothetical protein